jgi:hypothetical protein
MGNVCEQSGVTEKVIPVQDPVLADRIGVASSSRLFHEVQDIVDLAGTAGSSAPQFRADRKRLALDDDPADAVTSSGAPKFVGSYGKLMSFMRKCLEADVVSEKHFRELVAALEDLSDSSDHVKHKNRVRHLTVNAQQLFSGVSEQELVDGMGLMEMDTGPQPTYKRKSSMNEGSFVCEDEGVTDIAELLRDVDFNCRLRGQNFQSDIQAVTYGFTTPYNLVGRYSINPESLASWVSAIADQYQENPYHNWMHAFDVYQFIHLSLAVGGAGEFFNFQDILAMFCAAIGHDVAHGGMNNAFLINTGAKLAITYNDRSVLENMHASKFFETYNVEGNSFLNHIRVEDFKTFRSKVIENILATDMSHHFELVDKFNERVANKQDIPFGKNTKDDRDKQKETKSDRRMLMQAFTHMADLSHCTRPWDVHKTIVVCLEEEFFCQGDKEKEFGIPISPMMDRSKDSAATGQTFFLDKLVRPLLDPFCTFLHAENSSMKTVLKSNLISNRDKWAELVEKHGRLKAKDLCEISLLEGPTSSEEA